MLFVPCLIWLRTKEMQRCRDALLVGCCVNVLVFYCATLGVGHGRGESTGVSGVSGVFGVLSEIAVPELFTAGERYWPRDFVRQEACALAE